MKNAFYNDYPRMFLSYSRIIYLRKVNKIYLIEKPDICIHSYSNQRKDDVIIRSLSSSHEIGPCAISRCQEAGTFRNPKLQVIVPHDSIS